MNSSLVSILEIKVINIVTACIFQKTSFSMYFVFISIMSTVM